MGQVGLEWQVVEFGTFNGDFTGDMLMQDVKTGQFEVYDISNNQIAFAAGMGQVGTQWVPSGPSNLAGVTTAQITQAMAAFAPAGGAVPMSQQIDQPTLQASTATSCFKTSAPGNQRPGSLTSGTIIPPRPRLAANGFNRRRVRWPGASPALPSCIRP